MPWEGLVTFNPLQIFPGAPLANWAFTAISAFGLVAVFCLIFFSVLSGRWE